ncbi:MAG: hypothetical protein KJZ86_06515 [Caldilineaceae bacterium]|nr:hypothetical protein [Caldilineaceae bacterium]
MKSWLHSVNGAMTLSTLAFLTFLGRAFLDWRYEYPYQDPAGNWDTPGTLIYMALAGVWMWGLLAGERGSRRGWMVVLVWVLLLDVALALATYFILCPPWTGCEGWPNVWAWNWANLLTGVAAAIALGMQLRQPESRGLRMG